MGGPVSPIAVWNLWNHKKMIKVSYFFGHQVNWGVWFKYGCLNHFGRAVNLHNCVPIIIFRELTVIKILSNASLKYIVHPHESRSKLRGGFNCNAGSAKTSFLRKYIFRFLTASAFEMHLGCIGYQLLTILWL